MRDVRSNPPPSGSFRGPAWRFPLAVAAAMLAAAPGPAVSDEALAARVEAVVPPEFSGQVVIGTPDRILYAGRFGMADREEGIAVTDETLFDIGSVTKTFTATAVLRLAVDGRLGLDQTLGRWFDGLPEATAAITVHQLLTHTSGLPLYSGDDDAACDRACFDGWLAATAPEFPPGARFAYSNPGYSALARIIEKVDGRTYEAYLQEVLAEPLALGPLGYLRLPADSRAAVGYLDGERVGRPQELGWMDDGPSWHLRGNGGLLASAGTLYRWLRATADGRTLPADWLDRQLHPHAERREGVDYGYGWGILSRPWGEVVDHTGGNGFFFADARWFREVGLLLAVTDNAFEAERTRAMLQDLRGALGLGDPPE
jgi:CubicO group peptidase (beta-lactamase class C family)